MKKIIRINESEFFSLIKKIIKESYSVNDKVNDFTIISDKRGHQTRKLGNWQSDNAWDLGGSVGTPVYSYTKGKVKKVFTSEPTDKIFGTQVTVDGIDGYPDIFYTHLDNVNLTVGQMVNPGDLIGKIGNWTKHPEWTHVHIGLSDDYDLKDLIEKGVQPPKKEETPKNRTITNLKMYDYKVLNGKYFFKLKNKTRWIRAKNKKGIDAIKKLFLNNN
jgi:murein DD-endopeptidase MepM/ murein hydrolase activator NlpD